MGFIFFPLLILGGLLILFLRPLRNLKVRSEFVKSLSTPKGIIVVLASLSMIATGIITFMQPGWMPVILITGGIAVIAGHLRQLEKQVQ